MRWWLKAVIGVVAWTAFLAVGDVVLVVIIVAAKVPHDTASRVEFGLGQFTCAGWGLGMLAIPPLCYALQSRPEEEQSERRRRRQL
jgi:hypothetical protein